MGSKIHATVRKNLLQKFSSLLEEGSAYKFVYFSVVPNSGHYRSTYHEYKLIFLFKTTVLKKENPLLPMHGFTFVPFSQVLTFDDSYDNLIDVIGVLTSVFPKREYMKDGKTTSMVTIELTDSSGKLECALFGAYVDQLRSFLKGENVQVVVIIQLARVKTFRGKTVIQNSMNATRLMLNPDVPAAIEFRNGIAEHGLVDVEPMSVVLDNSVQGLQSEFLKLHPKKTIGQLESIQEDGMFIVYAEIVELIADSNWFYMACKCNKSVNLRGSVYFCESCMVPVLRVTPKFKLKVEVTDFTDCAVFVLFDRDVSLLLQKSCEELLCDSYEVDSDNGYPIILKCLIGKKLLFKVETRVQTGMHLEDSYSVRKIYLDEDVVGMFQLFGSQLTPTKAVFAPSFPAMGNQMKELEEPSSSSGVFGLANSEMANEYMHLEDLTDSGVFAPAHLKMPMEKMPSDDISSSQNVSNYLLTTANLGGAACVEDDDCCIARVTLAKRKLDHEFLEVQDGSAADREKAASTLLKVKIEKE